MTKNKETDRHEIIYLLEGGNHYDKEARKALQVAQALEAKRKTIPVWYDKNTTRLVSMEKIKRRKMEIIKVKIGKGELVFMEKEIAKKNGFINE